MYKIFLFVIMIISTVGSCKSDTDILAESTALTIKRGEFHKWMNTRKLPLESILKNKGSQKNYLRKMAAELLTYESYLKSDKKDDAQLKFLETVVYKNFLAGYNVKKIRESLEYEEKCSDISIIRLPYNKITNKKVNPKISKVQDSKHVMVNVILPRLKKGESFGKLAKEFSADRTKNKEGHVGFVAGKMMGEELYRAIKDLREGEYTVRPVRIRNGLFLVKVNRRVVINKGNIASIVKDERNRKGLERYLLFQSVKKYIEELEKESGSVSHIEKSFFQEPGEVLFEVGDVSFTNSELIEIENLFSKLSSRRVGKMKFDRKRKMAKARGIYSERLLCLDAVDRGVDRESDFVDKWKMYRKTVLAKAYKFLSVYQGVSVSGKEVREDYKKFRDKRYTRKVSGKKVVMPYAKVKESIENRLFSNKLNGLKRKWDSDMLKKYNFAIKEDKLEGK